METYLLTYLGSAFLALTVTPLVIRFANRFNMVDIPGARHMHKKPVPRIGGVAIFLSAIAGTVGVLLFSDVGSAESGGALGKVIVLLFAAGLVFFVGLVDDIKTGGLAAGMKLLAQIIAALAVCAVGIRIRSVTVVEGFTLDFGWFSWPLTLLWIVGITNAVNLSDGLDLFSMLRRVIDRRSMFAPDRRHFHHRLVEMGLKQRHAVVAIYITTLLFAGLGLFMIVTRNIASLTIFFCILLLLLLAFHTVGSVRIRETIAGLQRKYAIARRIRREIKSFEHAQLSFQNAHTFDAWWSAVCEAAEQMDFAWVSLKTQDKSGTFRTEVWRPADLQPEMSGVVVMNVPIRSSGLTRGAEFEIAINVNGTFESAGHRATLFSRLIDEHQKLIGDFQR